SPHPRSTLFPYTTLFRSGVLQKQTAQRHASTFTARKDFHWSVRRWATQSIHRHLQTRIQIPGVELIELLLHLALSLQQLVHLIRSEEHTSELQSRSDLVC